MRDPARAIGCVTHGLVGPGDPGHDRRRRGRPGCLGDHGGGDDSNTIRRLVLCARGPRSNVTLYQEPPGATYNLAKLPLQVLVFGSPVERRVFEARISSDGSTIAGPGCSAISDYVAPPHWYGADRYLLLLVSDDSATIADVAAAAIRIGAP